MALIDRASGSNYLRATTASPCAFILQQGREHAATAARLADGILTLRFGTSGITATIKAEALPSCITLTVQAVDGGTARVRIAELIKTSPESAPDVEMMLLFFEQTSPQRGIVR